MTARIDQLRTSELMESLLASVDKVHGLVRELTERDATPPIVVLVSRRMSCVYEMLVLRGFIERFDCDVVSDRLLASSPQWAERSVILFDDSLIVGTTLARRYVELAEAINEQVDGAYPSARIVTVVAAVDSERCNANIVTKLGIALEGSGGPPRRNSKQMQEFSRDITSLLYRQGQPYFSDFPITIDLETTQTALERLLADRSRWEAVEVRVDALADQGQTSYSLFPTADTRKRFVSRVATPARSQLEKVRVFVRRDPGRGRDARLIRLVPIAVPEPMRPGPLHDRLRAAATNLRPHSVKIEEWLTDWKPQAQHRLLQFYLSSALLAEFWNDLHTHDVTERGLGIECVHEDPLRHYFGNENYASVQRAFEAAIAFKSDPTHDTVETVDSDWLTPPSTLGDEPEVRRVLTEVSESGAFASLATSPDEMPVATSHWAMPVLSIFGAVAETVGKRQEELLQSMEWSEFLAYLANPGTVGERVLNLGLTIAELAKYFCSGDQCDARTISLAIDLGNDSGIAVPTTAWNDGDTVVHRHYRPGENAVVVEPELLRLGRLTLDEALQNVPWLIAEEFGLHPESADLIDPLEDKGVRRFAYYHNHLVRKARASVPDRLEELLVGVVTRTVEDDDALAGVELQVTPSVAGTGSMPAFLPADMFPRSQRANLLEGAIVKWTIMVRDDDSMHERVVVVGAVEDQPDLLTVAE